MHAARADRSCRTLLALAIGLLILLCLPGRVRADESADQARQYNAEAKIQFNLGNFSQAAELYKKAYEAKPVPEFLYNVAQCYTRMAALDNLEKALFYFESYLNNAPAAANRADVEAEIAELKRQIESLRRNGVKADSQRRAAPPAAVTPLPASAAGPARSRPVYKRWWFWTVVGAAIVGGTVGAIAATTGGSSRMPAGADGRFDPSSFGNK